MQKFLVTTEAELEQVIIRAVMNALQKGQAPINTQEFFSIEEAAPFLKLTKNTIYGMVSRREIPYYKRGKKLYFKVVELSDWLNQKKFATKTQLKDELNATGTIGCLPKSK